MVFLSAILLCGPTILLEYTFGSGSRTLDNCWIELEMKVAEDYSKFYNHKFSWLKVP